jgi:hypothetical protein
MEEHPVHIGHPLLIGQRVLSYGETCALTWDDDTPVRLLGSVAGAADNEKLLIPIEAHKAVVQKLQTDGNDYSTTKSYGELGLDLNGIRMQIVQLVNIVVYSTMSGRDISLVVLLVLSLVFQFIVGILLLCLIPNKSAKIGKKYSASRINIMVTVFTWLLLTIGFAITAIEKISPIINATTAIN